MNVNIDLSVFYVLFCFFIVFFVAKNTLWKRLDQILSERHEMIEGSRAKAADNDEVIEEKLASMNQALGEARDKAYAQRVEARERALKQQTEIVDQARQQSRELVEKNQKELDISVAEARTTLEQESEEYARSIANTLMRRSA